MTTSSSPSSSARFDLFHVDLSSGELTKSGGDSTRIQQQPLQVLRLLLEAEGRVVIPRTTACCPVARRYLR